LEDRVAEGNISDNLLIKNDNIEFCALSFDWVINLSAEVADPRVSAIRDWTEVTIYLAYPRILRTDFQMAFLGSVIETSFVIQSQ
jgi:hypothetical protein